MPSSSLMATFLEEEVFSFENVKWKYVSINYDVYESRGGWGGLVHFVQRMVLKGQKKTSTEPLKFSLCVEVDIYFLINETNQIDKTLTFNTMCINAQMGSNKGSLKSLCSLLTAQFNQHCYRPQSTTVQGAITADHPNKIKNEPWGSKIRAGNWLHLAASENLTEGKQLSWTWTVRSF